ncbi:MAG: PAS domain-containing protein, partial [Betaproteobacteria bacterium]|nr:PAS domain-containing protein [Betaproteobacteria bacterium]
MTHPSSPAVSPHEQVLGALEALDVGIAVYDAADHLIFCNQRFRQLHRA